MISRTIDLRLRRIEKQRHANRFAHLSEEQLDAMIMEDLAVLCTGYPTVNAFADTFRESPSLENQQIAEQLDWYIGFVAEEREAGRRA